MIHSFLKILHKIRKSVTRGFEGLAQCALITLELFNKNGLANHAAASAYGFLFSAVPAMLIVSFFVSQVLRSSQETAVALIGQMGLISQAFDMRQLTQTFLSVSKPGVAGMASIIGLLWTARIFALSLQRGLGVIFPDTDTIKPFRKMVTSVVIEAAIILFAFIIAFGSNPAFLMYHVGEFPPVQQRTSDVLALLIPLTAAALFIGAGYTLVPAAAPKRRAVFAGTLFCICSFALIFFLSNTILRHERYDDLYGTLGNLLLLLVNVYFLFIFFFLGAELTFIVNSFDSLLLSRFLDINSKIKKMTLSNRWFASLNGALQKYVCRYEKGAVVFRKGEKSREIYYILSGSAGAYLEEAASGADAAAAPGVMVALIEQGKFFGEMGHVLLEGRSATIRAQTDLEVLVIPPDLFEDVLKHNADEDQKMITVLSERLKDANEKLSGNQ